MGTKIGAWMSQLLIPQRRQTASLGIETSVFRAEKKASVLVIRGR